MHFNNPIFFSCIAALVFTSAAGADENAGSTPETVVVTATRTEQPLDVTGESLSVVTANDLKLEQTIILTDILAETPGLDVSRSGGVGETTDVTIRGSAPGQVLVLLDGVRINDPSEPDGNALLSDMLVNNIARVEVLRGPQSTLYGSQAIGGVINIITNTGGEGVSATATAEGGSYGTYRFNAATNGSLDRIDYGAAVNWFATVGTPTADPQLGATGSDSDHNIGATFNTRTRLTDALSFDLRGYFASAKVEYDGFPPPDFLLQHDGEFGRDQLGALYAGLNLSLFDGLMQNRIAFSGTASADRNYGVFNPVTFAFSPDENYFGKGGTAHAEYQGVLSFADKTQLTFGAENERKTLDTNSLSPYLPLTPARQGHDNILSGYAQLQSEVWDGLTLTGGVRDDDHETYGNHVSFKFAGAWQLFGGQAVLRANYGNGFKEPTLYQLFSQYSNPVHTLSPETASGWEAGVDEYFFDRMVRLSQTYFSRNTDDQIAFIPCDGPTSAACALRPIGYYDNISRTFADGVEFEAAAQLTDTIGLSANYTYLDTEDLATHSVLLRQPRDAVFTRLSWIPMEGLSLAASVGFTGSSYDQPDDVGHLGAYTLLNLYASYRISDRLDIFGRIENAADMHYATALGYSALGRAAYAGLRAHI